MIIQPIISGQTGLLQRRHRLAGVVTDDNAQPISRLVCVFHRTTKALLAAVWSDPITGAWEISGIPEYPRNAIFVCIFDASGNYNAISFDYISQVPSPGVLDYFSVYPIEHSTDFVKATTKNSNEPWFATDPTKSVVGADSYNSWQSQYSIVINQKFNIDLGSEKVVRRIMLENMHSSGSQYEMGIRNFSVYGTNSSTAFLDTVYASLTDLVLLGDFIARAHTPIDQSDQQYFSFNNSVGYRYYVLRISTNNGNSMYMGFRHIVLQT